MNIRLCAALCLLAAPCLLASSCVHHSGRVHIANPQATVLQDGQLLDADARRSGAFFQNPLPAETHVDAWHRDQTGALFRAHVHLQSPKPLWQRFPADMVSDLLIPVNLIVHSEQTITLRPHLRYTAAQIDTTAAQYGYK